MKKFIIAAPHPSTGISNKIKCILSVLRFCDHFSLKPLLYWPDNIMCPTKFSDLFETKIPQLDEENFDKIKKTGDFSQCSSYADFINSNHEYSIFNTWRLMLFPEDIPKNFAEVLPDESGKNIDLEFERIPIKLRKEYLRYIKKLKPAKEVRRAVNPFSKKNNLINSIGVHIRRGDFINYWDGRGKVSSDEKFFEKMSEIIAKNRKTKFFLATDSKETQEKFIKKFGKRIVVYPNKDFQRNTEKSIKDAFVDMLLLSKTKYILGTYLSTFTEIAWWFGGCKKKVEIIGDKNLMKEVSEKNKARLNSKTFKGYIKGFIRSILKKSFLLGKIHEKLEYRQFKKQFSSQYSS